MPSRRAQRRSQRGRGLPFVALHVQTEEGSAGLKVRDDCDREVLQGDMVAWPGIARLCIDFQAGELVRTVLETEGWFRTIQCQAVIVGDGEEPDSPPFECLVMFGHGKKAVELASPNNIKIRRMDGLEVPPIARAEYTIYAGQTDPPLRLHPVRVKGSAEPKG